MGFALWIIIGVPLPLCCMLSLSVDLIADLWPAISFAYEYPETDIMERPPRNTKREFIVNRKLFFHTQVMIGFTEAFAAVFVYFMVLNDYGIRPGTLLGLSGEYGYFPAPEDVYNPNAVNMGNSNYGNPDYYDYLDWGLPTDGLNDLRLFFTGR
jgi:magnesium-transporting ATPase (P-type)